MTDKRFDKVVVELQLDGRSVVAVSLDSRSLAMLEEMNGVPLREHVANMVDVLVGSLAEKDPGHAEQV